MLPLAMLLCHVVFTCTVMNSAFYHSPFCAIGYPLSLPFCVAFAVHHDKCDLRLLCLRESATVATPLVPKTICAKLSFFVDLHCRMHHNMLNKTRPKDSYTQADVLRLLPDSSAITAQVLFVRQLNSYHCSSNIPNLLMQDFETSEVFWVPKLCEQHVVHGALSCFLVGESACLLTLSPFIQAPFCGFAHPRYISLRKAFQERLAMMEQEISHRNTSRDVPYTAVMPSAIKRHLYF